MLTIDLTIDPDGNRFEWEMRYIYSTLTLSLYPDENKARQLSDQLLKVKEDRHLENTTRAKVKLRLIV